MSDQLGNPDFLDSVKNAIKDRLGSVLYGTLAIAWCIWNWKLFYVTFFVDQDLIFSSLNLLKSDYIFTNYFTLSNKLDWLHLIVGPLLTTFAIVFWPLPQIDFQFFRSYQANKIKKREELFALEDRLLSKEKSVLVKRGKNVEVAKRIKSEMTNEERWDEEYQAFKNSNTFLNSMSLMKECLYGNRGILSNMTFSMPDDNSAFLDVNGLIKFDDNNQNLIKPTEKGKYFMKKYLDKK